MWGTIIAAVSSILIALLAANVLTDVETRDRHRLREELELLEHTAPEVEGRDELSRFVTDQIRLYMDRSTRQRAGGLIFTFFALGFLSVVVGAVMAIGLASPKTAGDLVSSVWGIFGLMFIFAGYAYGVIAVLSYWRKARLTNRTLRLRRINAQLAAADDARASQE